LEFFEKRAVDGKIEKGDGNACNRLFILVYSLTSFVHLVPDKCREKSK
jgi:hypothetical protein